MVGKLASTKESWIIGQLEDASLSARQRAVFDLWMQWKGDSQMPSTEHCEAMNLPYEIIPYMAIGEVRHDPFAIYTRLAGTAMEAAAGWTYQGSSVAGKDGTEGAYKRFKTCVETGEPYFFEGPLTWSPLDYKDYSSLVLPFADKDGNVVRVMMIYEFF